MCKGGVLDPLRAAKKTTQLSVAGAKAGTNFAADATKKTNRALRGGKSGNALAIDGAASADSPNRLF